MNGIVTQIFSISARVKPYKNTTIKYAFEPIGYQTMAEDLGPLRYGMTFHAVTVFFRGL